MVDFDSSYCLENCSAGSTRTQGLGKLPTIEKIMPLNPESIEPCVQDVSDLEKSVPPGPVSTWNLDSIHSDVYPFLDASPDSNSSVPADIFKELLLCSQRSSPRSSPSIVSSTARSTLSQMLLPIMDKLRLCMDYRGLNKNTIKDRNPIPLISEMLRTLSIGKVFTTLDLRGAYNLLRIKEGDEPQDCVYYKVWAVEFLVMPFGLANAPAQFQRMMNTLFRDSIGKFVLVYLDDIVVYSENLEKHKEHVKSVLTILSKNGPLLQA
ncbi:hypothetical protein BASA83_013377 [Batrachochytrium salamandrivorans]|nr:hypothetical protein BASA83_013377 [Batrachochytrium salamandrivorans]